MEAIACDGFSQFVLPELLGRPRHVALGGDAAQLRCIDDRGDGRPHPIGGGSGTVGSIERRPSRSRPIRPGEARELVLVRGD